MISNRQKRIFSFLTALLIFGLFIALIYYAFPARKDLDLSTFYPWRKLLFKGWLLTIFASVIVLIASVIFGFSLYLLTNSKILVLKYLGDIFNEVIFGSPLVVFIILIFYFVGAPLNIDNRIVLGIIALSLYMAPYMKNIFEGAMESIDDIQYQAMTVFGFTTYQKYRYIIIPQLLKILIPPLAGNLTFIVKGSSLLNFIGVPELYNAIITVSSTTYAVVEGYIFLFIMYLMITIPLIRLTKYFEKKVALWN